MIDDLLESHPWIKVLGQKGAPKEREELEKEMMKRKVSEERKGGKLEKLTASSICKSSRQEINAADNMYR